MPMPVHGARATDGAFRTAAIPRTSNAGPPFSAWGDFARQIHSPEPPTGRAPEAGIPPARRGVIGGAIRYGRRTSSHRLTHVRLARRAPKAPTIGGHMRTVLFVVLVLAAFCLTPTGADAGAWCATYRWGGTNCGYSSSDQCWATVRGIGVFCRPNPFPGTAYGTSSGSWNAPNSPNRFQRGY